MKTITEQLADALREINDARYVLIDALKQSNYADNTTAFHDAFDNAREALAAYDAQQTETLTIRVNGEAARMALCDCLKGWHARRDGTWHVITTHANRAHMLALINDLGIRAKVMP